MSYGDFVTRYACGHETRVTMFAFGPGPDVISTKLGPCTDCVRVGWVSEAEDREGLRHDRSNARLANLLATAAYYTVRIPYAEYGTKWHPTDESGPYSVLTRGTFATTELAHDWARANIDGYPYSVVQVSL